MPAGGSAAPSDLTERFFDPETVQTIRIEVKPEDLNRLQRALPDRISVPGAFRWNDQAVDQAGVRYKGDSSSSPNAQHKRSFLIDFSEFIKRQRFLGLRHVALDNGIQFGSLFSERLITDILRNVGVKASRCNYARVYLNSRYLGIYVNVERLDRSFIERHFGSDEGVMFKVSRGGPGADLRCLGPEPALYRKAFELHAGPEEEGYRSLAQWICALADPAGTGADLSSLLDLEAFLSTTAVMLLAGAFDQYTGWNAHNYYLYQNPRDQRWTYIPWDLDVGFADHAFGKIPVLEGWNAAWPAPVPGRPLMERLVSDPGLLEKYRKKAKTLLESSFQPEVLIPKLRGLYAQIQADLKEEPYPPRRVTVPSDRSYEDIITSMEAFIRKRYLQAREQLHHPGPRPRSKGAEATQAEEGPRPGPASADAPSDLVAEKVTSSMVQLRWKDHAEGEVAFVVQRCLGADGTDFQNAIGQGGENLTGAVDHQVEPGKTYRYRIYAVLPTAKGPRGTGVSNVITVRIPRN